jgi:hypothetical protein
MYEYLKTHREPLPEWLGEYRKSSPFPRDQFFASRICFYPGAGNDGHAVKVFGSTDCTHCFVYVDLDISQPKLQARLANPLAGFRGYHTYARIQLVEEDLVTTGWVPHVYADEVPGNYRRTDPYGFLEILERDPDLDDKHGPSRLALLFLGAEADATFDALFCQDAKIRPPYAILLQNHGFGGNRDQRGFGEGSLLERLAIRCGVYPQFLLVAENTDAWTGYEAVPNAAGEPGGLHGQRRRLYQRQKSAPSASC